MKGDYVTRFLDLMDYLNTNAKKMGGRNIKDLMCKAVNSGRYESTKWDLRRFTYFCDLRNDIAHGGASYVTEINNDVLFDMYFQGVLILFISSREWEVVVQDNDMYCYHEGKLKVKFSKLIKKVKQDNELLFIDFYKWKLPIFEFVPIFERLYQQIPIVFW